MSAGGWTLALVIATTLGTLAFLLEAFKRGVNENRRPREPLRKGFGLGLALLALFLITWAAHGIAEWQTYTDQQATHGEPTNVGDFTSEFATATLENWQSEFLQLFAFVTLSAVYLHRGSAESKDTDEETAAKLEAMDVSLADMEEKLDLLRAHFAHAYPGWQGPAGPPPDLA